MRRQRTLAWTIAGVVLIAGIGAVVAASRVKLPAKGDEIPLLARVIAVADTFDAVTTNRPYQKAHEAKEALIDPVTMAAKASPRKRKVSTLGTLGRRSQGAG